MQDTYDLVVTVTDGDVKTNSATVTVVLEDVNDNAPQFDSSSYDVVVPSTSSSGLLTSLIILQNKINPSNLMSGIIPLSSKAVCYFACDLYPKAYNNHNQKIFSCDPHHWNYQLSYIWMRC